MDLIDSLRVPISEDVSRANDELPVLNKLGFVRAETAEAQWLLLVTDAWRKSKLPLDELVRDYLALMLGRFLSKDDLLDIFVGYEYHLQFLKADQVDDVTLRDLADISMLYVSLFPGRVAYRHYPHTVRMSVDLGAQIYARLYDLEADDWWKGAYEKMSQLFMRAVMVLKTANPHLFAQEEGLRKIYGKAVHFHPDVHQRMVKHQASVFELVYLTPAKASMM